MQNNAEMKLMQMLFILIIVHFLILSKKNSIAEDRGLFLDQDI